MTYNHEKRKTAKRKASWKGQGLKNSYYKYIQELKEKDKQLIEKIMNIRREMQIVKKKPLKLKSKIYEMKWKYNCLGSTSDWTLNSKKVSVPEDRSVRHCPFLIQRK